MPSTRAAPASKSSAASGNGAGTRGGKDIKQDHRFIAIDTPLGKDKLGLVSFTGQESLSHLFQFELELVGTDNNLDFDALVAQPVSLRINTAHGGKRWFHGHVSRLTHLAPWQRYGRYQATIVPWTWFLTRTADCRIYQKKTVPQIVEDVFKRNQFPDFEWRVKGQYTPWEYCVQYRETDFNFISRLLEQEGIYYFFKHEQKKHILVLCDDPTGHEPAKGYENVTYRPAADGAVASEYIYDWSMCREVQTTHFEHTDYDPLAPTKPLNSNYNLSRKHDHGSLAMFDYPGEFDETGDGKAWAKVRLQEIQARFEISEGMGDVRGLAAGSTFTLKEYPRKDQCRKHLVLSVRHSANAGQFESEGSEVKDQPTYHCSFRVIDASVNYRPPRVTPKPMVQGCQTAVVVGPAGQEIHVDDHARIKVQFHWDRYGQNDENSSCWIRVAQPWAGKGYGGMNIPRIGQEVIVDFLEGDPDQPVINGRLYNADSMPHASNAGRDGKPGNTPPGGIPAAAMMTSFKSSSLGGSGGHNEITMNDAAGAEGLFLKAQKDEIHTVGHDREDTVTHDETRKVGNDCTITVDGKHTETIKKNTTIHITEGDVEHKVVAGKADYSVAKTQCTTVKLQIKDESTDADILQMAKDKICLDSGGGKSVAVLRPNGEIEISSAEQIKLITGASSITLKKDGTITISGKKITVSGTDEASMGVGNQNVKCDMQQVATAGAAISSSAMGKHEISGAVVKIN